MDVKTIADRIFKAFPYLEVSYCVVRQNLGYGITVKNTRIGEWHFAFPWVTTEEDAYTQMVEKITEITNRR